MPRPLTILPDAPPPPAGIGLIAGGGRLPIRVATGLRASGYAVHGLGLGQLYDPALPGLCATFREVGLLRVGSWVRALTKLGLRHAIMVGKVDKARLMHHPWRLVGHLPDVRTAVGFYRHLRHDRRTHALLGAIAEELDRCGVQLLDSTMPITSELASPGVMTRRSPTADQAADVAFAWPLLGEMLRLDIGQSIVVRQRDVIAVEAVEGTDRMIDRAGLLCRSGGWTMCKGARPGHDRRADVPAVGPDTVRRIHAAGGACLALAAGDVIMIDRDQMLSLADELGVAVVGVSAGSTGA